MNSVEIRKAGDDVPTLPENYPDLPSFTDDPSPKTHAGPTEVRNIKGDSRAREPEPVPVFSCIYCVNEFLVFSGLSHRLLAKKYTAPLPSVQPSAAGHQIEVPADTAPKDPLVEALAAQSQSVYVPTISEESVSLRWVLRKYYIAKKNRVTSSDCALSPTLQQHSTKKSLFDLSPRVEDGNNSNKPYINIDNAMAPEDHGIMLENTSFSSSEHDIYSPAFSSSSASSDTDQFLAAALCDTRELHISPVSTAAADEVLLDPLEPAPAVPDPIMILPANWSTVEQRENSLSFHSGAQTTTNDTSPYRVNTARRIIISSHGSVLTNPMSRTPAAKDATPESFTGSSGLMGFTQAAAMAGATNDGANSRRIVKCGSVQQLIGTRNVHAIIRGHTMEHMIPPPVCRDFASMLATTRIPPKPGSMRPKYMETARKLFEPKRLVNYRSVLSKKKPPLSGAPTKLPKFTMSVIPSTVILRATHPLPLKSSCCLPSQFVHVLPPRSALRIEGTKKKQKKRNTSSTNVVSPKTKPPLCTMGSERMLNRCLTNCRPIRLDFGGANTNNRPPALAVFKG